MSTDPNLGTARAYVADRLRSKVPADWRIIDTLAEHKNLTVPAVYLEYTRLEVATELPPGQVRAVMYASVFDPSTDTTKSENAADEHVIELAVALDQDEKLSWTGAEKLRLATGEIGWRITVTILCHTSP